MKTRFLFPHAYRKVGWIILVPFILIGIPIVFWDFKFDFLDLKAFAFYSDMPFFGTPTYFGWIATNLTATVIGIGVIVGAVLVAFSKQKFEDEFVAQTRFESLVWATYTQYALLIFCFIFFYDFGFLTVMVFNMFTLLFIFILRFQFVQYRNRTSLDHEK